MNNNVSQSVAHLHTHVVPRRRKDGLRGFFWPRVPYAERRRARRLREPHPGGGLVRSEPHRPMSAPQPVLTSLDRDFWNSAWILLETGGF